MLSHNPDVQDLPIWDGVRGWALAGHTHGGQVKPPFLPPPILPVQNKRYTAGAFDVGPGRTLYVNRGLGFFYQVRFDVRPELGRIAAPTLVLAGAEDPATPVAMLRQIADAVPGARLVVLRDAAHLPNVEQPAQVVEALAEHLRRAS